MYKAAGATSIPVGEENISRLVLVARDKRRVILFWVRGQLFGLL